MVAVAVWALIIFHPGFGFQNKFNEIKYRAVAGVEGGRETISLTGGESVPYHVPYEAPYESSYPHA
jgi:hypothetical protein